MHRFRRFLLAGLLFLAGLPGSSLSPAEPDSPEPDVAFLQDHQVPTDNANLLAYLRKRSQYDDDLLDLDRLIRQLGDPLAARREDASRTLAEIGLAALSRLRQATKDPDPEIAHRARAAVEVVSRDETWALPGAAVRVLLQRKPAGTAEALLGFLPYVATDETTAEDIWFGSYDLAKADPSLLPIYEKALADRLPSRRALAGLILGRLGSPEQKFRVRKLLTDTDPTVRLRAAQGLLAGKDASGIPTLIALLEEKDVPLAWQAEELLHWAAGKESPSEKIGYNLPHQSKATRSAWEKWWQFAKQTIDLGQLDQEPRRPRLLWLFEVSEKQDGCVPWRVWLCGCDGKERWLVKEDRVEAVYYSIDTFKFLGDRFQITTTVIRPEYVRMLAELSIDGTTLRKEETADGTREFEVRLPNGNTFKVQDGKFIESSADGAILRVVVNEGPVRERTVFDAQIRHVIPTTGRLISLHVNWERTQWIVREWDRSTFKELRRFVSTDNPLEWKPAQKPRWPRISFPAGWPVHAVGFGKVLPSGNLLFAGTAAGWCDGLFEMTAQGKVVWEAFVRGDVWRFEIAFPLLEAGFDESGRGKLDLLGSFDYQVRRLKGKDPEVRDRGFTILARMGERAAPAVPLLLELLDGADDDIATGAAGTLSAIGPTAAIPHVGKMLMHRSVDIRKIGLHCFSDFWPDTQRYYPQVVHMLKDKDPEIRRATVRSLRDIVGWFREGARPLLLALEDEDSLVRIYAVQAVQRADLDIDVSVPAFVLRLKDRDYAVRSAAIEALREQAPTDPRTIRSLIPLLKEKEGKIVCQVCNVLGYIGPAAREAVPLLESLERDADPEVRKAASEALIQIRTTR